MDVVRTLSGCFFGMVPRLVWGRSQVQGLDCACSLPVRLIHCTLLAGTTRYRKPVCLNANANSRKQIQSQLEQVPFPPCADPEGSQKKVNTPAEVGTIRGALRYDCRIDFSMAPRNRFTRNRSKPLQSARCPPYQILNITLSAVRSFLLRIHPISIKNPHWEYVRCLAVEEGRGQST